MKIFFLVAVKEAFLNLWANKLKSFLAMLGVWVGTGSVVAMVCAGELATQAALAQFHDLGTDLLAVSLFDQRGNSTSSRDVQLTENDVAQLPIIVKTIREAAPYTTLYAPALFNGHSLSPVVIGATATLKTVIKVQLAQGRFISFMDNGAYYCVIGNDIFQQLQRWGIKQPLGMQLHLGRKIFTIVGVAKPWQENSFFNQNINKSVMIPFQAAKRLSQYALLNEIVMQLAPDAPIDKTQDQISEFLKHKAPQKQPFFQSAKRIIASMSAQRHTLTLLLGAIGSISLLVGGIGIMNVMLVSVVERRREIGIRRAVGATRGDIQFLFLIEALVLALSGGVVGVISGVLVSFVLAYFAHWPFIFLWQPPVVGFAVSVLVGLFFGFYPAYKASRLDPMAVLREE